MSEDDTFIALKASRIVWSDHGGYYYFIPDYRVRSAHQPGDIWGHILCSGMIYDMLKGKKKDGQLFTDWLSTGWKQEKMIHQYKIMGDIYATHVTRTWPAPGIYWEWAE